MKHQLGRYLLILTAILVLWNTIILKPLKIFTVFLHELGHSLMALLFGYGISAFNVSLNEGGYTVVQSKGWFSTFMIANGGYLGSVLFALLILYLKKTPFKKFILGTLAIIFLTVTIRFSGFSFALVYSIFFAVFILVLYMLQKEKINDWMIDIIGVASAAYAIYDTFVDTILLQLNGRFHIIGGWSGERMTDAVQLAKMTHIPAVIWGVIWLAAALFAVNATLFGKTGSRRG